MSFYNFPLVKLCHTNTGWMTQVSSGSISLSDPEQSETIKLNICMLSILLRLLSEFHFSSLNSTYFYSIADVCQVNTRRESQIKLSSGWHRICFKHAFFCHAVEFVDNWTFLTFSIGIVIDHSSIINCCMHRFIPFYVFSRSTNTFFTLFLIFLFKSSWRILRMFFEHTAWNTFPVHSCTY